MDYHLAMDAPRLTVALTIDHDAISDCDPARRLAGQVSPRRVRAAGRGEADPGAAGQRARSRPRGSFPATRSTTFPDDTEAILAGGHELACHGWFHEDFAELGVDQTREVLGRSVEAVRAVTGAAPTGFRAPYWSLGAQTLELVEAAGFAYDSSLMADDYDLYRVRRGDRHSIAGRHAVGRAERARRGAGLLGDGRLAALRARSGPRRAVGAVGRPRDLDRGAALRPRARARAAW